MQRRGGGASICEINTTPLIDVMLVLLVTLIVTLPIMTHAVKLDMPNNRSAVPLPLPDVINLEIDFDGAVVWNGTPLSWSQLESHFRAAAARDPEPEVQLQPDGRARYDVVARVLASAQHNNISKVAFLDTTQFGDW